MKNLSKQISGLACIISLMSSVVLADPINQDRKPFNFTPSTKYSGEPGDVFATQADIFGVKTAGHLGVYIGDDQLLDITDDTSIRNYRRNTGASAVTNGNLRMAPPSFFTRSTVTMHEIKAIAPTGQRLTEKIRMASVAKHIMLSGADYHIIGRAIPASTNESCRYVYSSWEGRPQWHQECATIVTKGLYNCAQLVADVADRGVVGRSFGYYTCGGAWNPFPCHWMINYLPRNIMARFAALKISTF